VSLVCVIWVRVQVCPRHSIVGGRGGAVVCVRGWYVSCSGAGHTWLAAGRVWRGTREGVVAGAPGRCCGGWCGRPTGGRPPGWHGGWLPRAAVNAVLRLCSVPDPAAGTPLHPAIERACCWWAGGPQSSSLSEPITAMVRASFSAVLSSGGLSVTSVLATRCRS
jgi:hypothetical protein